MKYYTFNCGCKVPLKASVDLSALNKGVFNGIALDLEEVNYKCPAVWRMLAQGLTKGVFQLESNLGRQWSKKLRPESVEHLCALGALLRPGCLRSKDADGISMTEHYCLRKNHEEDTQAFHDLLREILAKTYQVLVYQEQAMRIAQQIAGFNLQEADALRKAIGHKLPEEMAKCKIWFLEGSKKLSVVTNEVAIEIFSWIEKSQRYSFNKSHSAGYAKLGYWTAWCKAHFPVQFFTSFLEWAKEKQKPLIEIQELVNEAKLMDIVIHPPDILCSEEHFSTDGVSVWFGFADVKGIGESIVSKITNARSAAQAELKKSLKDFTWYEVLTHLLTKMSPSIGTKLIASGAFSYLDISRNEALASKKVWDDLTPPEVAFIMGTASPGKDLLTALRACAPTKKNGGGTFNAKRSEILRSHIQLLENPPVSLSDTPNWIANTEALLLGTPISCSRVDSCDISEVNTSCKDYLAGRSGYMIFGVEIQSLREVKTKAGKTPGATMAYLTINDSTCSLSDVVCFPDVYKKVNGFLHEGNTILLRGERNKKNNSLIVQDVWQLR